ncbi:ABC-2 family transporter protein [Hamadaea flava]|uniref:ABC-2 family transporter protein n=1 Tax=Hamadaea flava TaxID=1742688 RepID=UPI0020A60B88|nr:ABC-2 family transporter protein [Hamadaea flava]
MSLLALTLLALTLLALTLLVGLTLRTVLALPVLTLPVLTLPRLALLRAGLAVDLAGRAELRAVARLALRSRAVLSRLALSRVALPGLAVSWLPVLTLPRLALLRAGLAVDLAGRAELLALRLTVRRLRVPRLAVPRLALLTVSLLSRLSRLAGLALRTVLALLRAGLAVDLAGRAVLRLTVRCLRTARVLPRGELAGRRTVAGLRVTRARVLRLTRVLWLAGVLLVAVGARRQRLAVRPELRLRHAGRTGRERPRRRGLAVLLRIGVVVGGLALSRHLRPRRGRRASPSWDVRPGPAAGALDGHATPREDRVAGVPAKTVVPPFPDDDRVTPAGREDAVATGGYGVPNVTATVARVPFRNFSEVVGRFGALAAIGFRRYATYRQAAIASLATNTMFGFLRSYVLLGVAAGTGAAAGYSTEQLLTFVWLGQGLIGVVQLWGWTELSDRIRSGDVVMDLLRPQRTLTTYLAQDMGRAGLAMLIRFAPPLIVASLVFGLAKPQHVWTYPLGLLSIVLAVVVCFCCRFLVNCCAYWLLDNRGPSMFWLFCSGLFGGLFFPLHFLPEPLTWALWLATPFPSLLQAPLDVISEYAGRPGPLVIVGLQLFWAAVLLGLCELIQRRAERKLVVQGG